VGREREVRIEGSDEDEEDASRAHLDSIDDTERSILVELSDVSS